MKKKLRKTLYLINFFLIIIVLGYLFFNSQRLNSKIEQDYFKNKTYYSMNQKSYLKFQSFSDCYFYHQGIKYFSSFLVYEESIFSIGVDKTVYYFLVVNNEIIYNNHFNLYLYSSTYFESEE